MSQETPTSQEIPTPAAPRKWRTLNLRQRRVAGVLVEKAKTTPDAYPMTLNGIVTGCNQKTNRDPITNLTPDDVEQVLEELKQFGVLVEVQGSGRVNKYRHLLYDWLGVEKVEMAVMTELLLRGEQTVGELRTRASRMEPIADLAALRPVLQSLIQKGLLLALTPEGRGQLVTHNLYPERELNEVKNRVAQGHYSTADDPDDSPPRPSSSSPAPVAPAPRPTPGVTLDMFAELRLEVAELRAEVGRLRNIVSQLEKLL